MQVNENKSHSFLNTKGRPNGSALIVIVIFTLKITLRYVAVNFTTCPPNFPVRITRARTNKIYIFMAKVVIGSPKKTIIMTNSVPFVNS